VLVKLGFDLNFPGIVAPLDRFLHLLGYNKIDLMVNLTFQMCKFTMNDPYFLKYRPSMIAACAVIICSNIYMRDKESYESTGVFAKGTMPTANDKSYFCLTSDLSCSKRTVLLQVNTQVWNNQQVLEVTGITYKALKQCLYELANYIRESLTPDRLYGFDLETILEADNFLIEDQDTEAASPDFHDEIMENAFA